MIPRSLLLAATGTSLVVFSRQVFWPMSSVVDFQQHIELARSFCQSGSAGAPHLLFEIAVCGLAAPVNRPWAFAAAAVAVATAAVVAKVILTYRRMRQAGAPGAARFGALCLLFAMPLPNWWMFPRVYLGQVTPNVWHNPTAILVLPIALLLFQAASAADRPRAAVKASALMLLNCLAKPNYALALLPCWLVSLLERVRCAGRSGRIGAMRRLAPVLAIVLVPTGAVLAWLSLRFRTEGSGVAIAPLAVWRLYSPHIAVSMLLGLAFPLAVTVLYFRAGRRQSSFVLAWSVLLVALLQMLLLAETGPRLTHANFFWGSYTASYVLFVESVVVLAAAPPSQRSRAAWGLLGAHAVVGVAYAIRIVAFGAWT